jgi:RNA polymerase sigma factor (sigma-70 family)
MNELRERKTIEAAIAGNREAFAELVRRYQGFVFGIAYSRLRNTDDAQDIAQSVFVSAFVGLARLRNQDRFGSWLRTITINTCNAHCAAKPAIAEIDPMALTPDHAHKLLERLAIEQAMSCLSEQTRAALTLFHLHSYSLREIAELLDMAESAVKSRLRDGRARLKKEMLQLMEQTVTNAMPGREFAARIAELAMAATQGDSQAALALLESDRSLTAGHGEVAPEHLDYMRQHNAHNGWTPLHLAAHYGHLDVVRMLLDHGADIEAVSQNAIANTPLSAAAWGDHRDIVAALLDHGAQVDAPNAWGSTALRRAVDAGREELARLLLSRGADPLRADSAGLTPLAAAEQMGDASMAALLRNGKQAA